MDYENIKVIDRVSNFKLRMKELLHILKEQPELNKQLNSQSYPQHRKMNETVATCISYSSHICVLNLNKKLFQKYFKLVYLYNFFFLFRYI
jgi:hypothetical protein